MLYLYILVFLLSNKYVNNSNQYSSIDRDVYKYDIARITKANLPRCGGINEDYVVIPYGGCFYYRISNLHESIEEIEIMFNINLITDYPHTDTEFCKYRIESISQLISPNNNCFAKYIRECDDEYFSTCNIDEFLHNSLFTITYKAGNGQFMKCRLPVIKLYYKTIDYVWDEETISIFNQLSLIRSNILHGQIKKVLQVDFLTYLYQNHEPSLYMCLNPWTQIKNIEEFEEIRDQESNEIVERIKNIVFENIEYECPRLLYGKKYRFRGVNSYYIPFAECYQRASIIVSYSRNLIPDIITVSNIKASGIYLYLLLYDITPIRCGKMQITYGIEFQPKRFNLVVYAQYEKFIRVATCQRTNKYTVCLSTLDFEVEIIERIYLIYRPNIYSSQVSLRFVFGIPLNNVTHQNVIDYSILDMQQCAPTGKILSSEIYL